MNHCNKFMQLHQINSFYCIIFREFQTAEPVLQDRGQPGRLKRKASLSNKRNLGLENDAEVGVLAWGSSSQEVCEVRNTMMIQVSTEQWQEEILLPIVGNEKRSDVHSILACMFLLAHIWFIFNVNYVALLFGGVFSSRLRPLGLEGAGSQESKWHWSKSIHPCLLRQLTAVYR